MNNQTVLIADLQPHSRNYNHHSAAQIARIAKSLSTFGQVRSIVTWHNTILAGHGVVLAAKSLGWDTIRADVQDHLTESQALAYVVADNELARQSDPDQAQLAAILEELQAKEPLLVEAAGYSSQELEQLLRLVNPKPVVDSEPQVDRAAELQKKWSTASGQLWAMGEHRLICGDCTDAAVVARVMGGELCSLVVTDPPYDLGDSWQGLQAYRGNEQVANDDRPDWCDWFVSFLATLPAVTTANASFYLWYALRMPVRQLVEANGYKVHAVIIWAKEHYNVGRADYHSQYEPCLYFSQGDRFWCGRRDVSDVWSANRVEQERLHPTQKPLSLIHLSIENSSELGGIVYDPFAGSGTTGVACQNLGRRARMVEISPAYCGVILERFMQIGVQPELVQDAVLEGA